MWEFVHDHGGLELNTAYAYIVLADDFSDTSIVVDDDDELAGFVLGYSPPDRPDALFVWQVGVSPHHRGRGLARRMIVEIARREDQALRYVEATVTPSNTASRKLFRSVARELDTECEVRDHLRTEHFPGGDHEAEDLFRIGPF